MIGIFGRDGKDDKSAPTNWRGIFETVQLGLLMKRQDSIIWHTFTQAQPDLNWEIQKCARLYMMSAVFG